MIKCPCCGMENTDNALQCYNCLAPLRMPNGSPVSPPYQPPVPPPSNPAMTPLRNHNGVGTFFKVMFWILLVLCVLAGLGNLADGNPLGLVLIIGGPIATLPLYFFGTVIEDLHDIKNILLSKK